VATSTPLRILRAEVCVRGVPSGSVCSPMATSNSATRGRVKFPQARTVQSVSQSAESLMARRWAASLSR
jgi:hypothetical protein